MRTGYLVPVITATDNDDQGEPRDHQSPDGSDGLGVNELTVKAAAWYPR